MRKAGYANGMYNGPAGDDVADNAPPGSNTAKVVAADLAKIGFKVQDDLGHALDDVHEVLRRAEERAERLPELGWLPDFNDPQTVLDVTFNGNRITPVNNTNWPLLNDPKINAAIERAERSSNQSAR